jgi:large subunit ribosomal protein L25
MEELKLKVARRSVLGKKTRFLRRRGVTPIHVFGHDVDSQALQCDTEQLKKIIARAGETRLISLTIEGDKEPKSVFVREVQRDPLGKQLFHVDFYQVKKEERIKVDVPVVLVGEAPALKAKGRILTRGINELNIECLPGNVPPQIEVDVSILKEVDQPIFVKDIVLDPSITVNADPEQLVVKVSEITLRAEEEVVVKEAAVEAEAEAAAPAEGAEAPAAEAPDKE